MIRSAVLTALYHSVTDRRTDKENRRV